MDRYEAEFRQRSEVEATVSVNAERAWAAATSLDENLREHKCEACRDDLLVITDVLAVALEALTTINETPYGKFASKGDYAAFVRDLARNALERP